MKTLLLSFAALLEAVAPVAPVTVPPVAVTAQRPRVAIIDSGVWTPSERGGESVVVEWTGETLPGVAALKQK